MPQTCMSIKNLLSLELYKALTFFLVLITTSAITALNLKIKPTVIKIVSFEYRYLFLSVYFF